MNKPPRLCDPDAFRTVHKLCARLTRKTPYALYLAVLHLSPADSFGAESVLQRALHGGEVYCRMPSNRIYILLFACTDEEAEYLLEPALRALRQSTLRIQRVSQRLNADPTLYA